MSAEVLARHFRDQAVTLAPSDNAVGRALGVAMAQLAANPVQRDALA